MKNKKFYAVKVVAKRVGLLILTKNAPVSAFFLRFRLFTKPLFYCIINYL